MITIASIIFYLLAMVCASVFGFSVGAQEKPDTALVGGAASLFLLGVIFQVFG